MDELTITVSIADRPYKLTIKREEEEVIRKAAELINKTVKEYSMNYSFHDKQDLLAMVALEFTSNAVKLEKEAGSGKNNEKFRLMELDGLLRNHLDNFPGIVL